MPTTGLTLCPQDCLTIHLPEGWPMSRNELVKLWPCQMTQMTQTFEKRISASAELCKPVSLAAGIAHKIAHQIYLHWEAEQWWHCGYNIPKGVGRKRPLHLWTNTHARLPCITTKGCNLTQEILHLLTAAAALSATGCRSINSLSEPILFSGQ